MPFEEEPIRYSKSPDTSPVARLQQRLERGEVTLERDGRWGYLLAVLTARAQPEHEFADARFFQDLLST
jgi:hypothetical protein